MKCSRTVLWHVLLYVSGEYSCLKVELIFKREFSYYLITIYVPCCMLVIVSWVSFWLDQNAIPARVSLGVTTLLTMSTQASGINAQLPPVSYTKAIDVWTGVSESWHGLQRGLWLASGWNISTIQKKAAPWERPSKLYLDLTLLEVQRNWQMVMN